VSCKVGRRLTQTANRSLQIAAALNKSSRGGQVMEDEWADIECELEELALRTDNVEAMLRAHRLKARDPAAQVSDEGSDTIRCVR
jgi:hypothetical protein